jgi:predicted nucleic acid-binding Zn ribbon protein
MPIKPNRKTIPLPRVNTDVELQKFLEDQLQTLIEFDRLECPNDHCSECSKEIAHGQRICEDCEIKGILEKGMDLERIKNCDYWIAPSQVELESNGYELIEEGDYDNNVDIIDAFDHYKKVIYICRSTGPEYDEVYLALWGKEKS